MQTQHDTTRHSKQHTAHSTQHRAHSREQRAESREQRAESREQRAHRTTQHTHNTTQHFITAHHSTPQRHTRNKTHNSASHTARATRETDTHTHTHQHMSSNNYNTNINDNYCLSFILQVEKFKGVMTKAGSTLRTSQAVPHPSTIRALCRLTSEVRRDPVHSTRYGRQRGWRICKMLFCEPQEVWLHEVAKHAAAVIHAHTAQHAA